MRISHNWLREYVPHPWDWRELVDRLTMAGLELEEVDDLGRRLRGVVVGEVKECEHHPNADRLSVCRVDLGEEGGHRTIVCGAPNVAAGQKVAVVVPGHELPDGRKIERVSIRGVTSHGMICAEDELGLGPDHDGILVLPQTYEVGAAFATQAGLDDVIIDFEVTPNRPDCLSLVGIAREVQALTEIAVELPDTAVEETAGVDPVGVEIEDPEGCPRYVGRLIRGVQIGPSPDWLAKRLLALGLRPINNVVDVTNYVMLELGQPLHAFDASRLEGRQIIVRRARSGESLETLDGVRRTLDEEMLVIADAVRPVALAGIMGGATAEVTASTTDILLEAAHFSAARVRRTAAALGMHTEASARFERGADWAMPPVASDRAAGLIAQLTGGQSCAPAVDVLPRDLDRPPIDVRLDRLNRLLSTALSSQQCTRILSLLGCDARSDGEGHLRVAAPSFRPDLTREADVIEEVGRIYGYDRIEASSAIRGPLVQSGDAAYDLQRFVRRRLAGLGLDEVVTNSVVERRWAEVVQVEALELSNPPAEGQSVLRTSLLPSLLDVARRNFNQRATTVSVFELGKCYSAVTDGHGERMMLAGLWSGLRTPSPWRADRVAADLLDLKGLVEALLEPCSPEFVADTRDAFRAGCCARVVVEECDVGHLGEADQPLCAAFDLAGPVFIFELNFVDLAPLLTADHEFRRLSRFPPIQRDLALLVPDEVPAAHVLREIRSVEGELIEAVELFDVYTGDQVDAGFKSLAFTFVLKSKEKTLEDREADEIIGRVLAHVESRCGARLRDS